MPRIRDAVPGDELAVATVHVRSWQAAYRGLLDDDFLDRLSPEDRAERYAFGAQGPEAPRTFVAELGGEILGFATIGPSRDADSRGLAELYALYVDPTSWRSGTGRLLLAEARSRMRDAGFGEAILWVLRRNSVAERLYLADGWHRDGGEREEQPYGIVSQVFRLRRSLADR